MEFVCKTKPSTTDEINSSPALRRYAKRWKIAPRKWNYNSVHRLNLLTESQYKDLLKKVKKQFVPSGTIMFEKDYRNDNTENAFSMHRFFTSSFSLELDCDFLYYYTVLYDFHNCPYEKELQQLITRFFAGLKTERSYHQPDLAAYFEVIKAYHPPELFTIATTDL